MLACHRRRFGVPQFMVLYAIVSGLFLAGCGSAAQHSSGTGASSTFLPSGPSPSPTPSPTPTITAISPNSAVAGGAPFVLMINGTNFNFTTDWTVNFGTTVIGSNGATPDSSTQLHAFIPAAAIASVGNLAVTVTTPGGGTSNAVNFTVTSGTNPVPTITYINPTCAPVGAQSLTVELTGSNFVAGSVVRWNGSDQPTTVFSGDDLIAQIPSGDIASAGTSTVTVFNPSPGGGSSTGSTFTIGTGGMSPQSIAVDPTGRFAYVANEGCTGDFSEFIGNVSMYAINHTTGALTSIGSPVAADFGAKSVTVDPSGKFAYVANAGGDLCGSVSMYTINPASGALTSIGTIGAPGAPPPSPGSCAPYSVAVDPSGRFAYVANEGGFAPTSLQMYSINPTTGALTFVGTIAAEGRAVSVAVDPTGKFAYATDVSNGFPGESNNVAMYIINTTTGALTSVGTIGAGLSPASIAIDPSGNSAYVANSGSNDVSMYSINTTTGVLTSLGPIAAGTGPSSVALDPMGKFAYVANSGSNDVLTYAINATTGVLTFTETIAAGSSPTSIAIDPSGKFAYVTNSDSNSVSMYSIDATTGALTLLGTIGT